MNKIAFKSFFAPLLILSSAVFSPAISLAAEKIKIGFVLSTMQEERYLKDKMYFEAAAKKLGAEVVFASCDNSERTQAQKIENLLSKGIKAIVIQPVNSEAAGSLVEAAHKAKIPVIAYDRIIKNADLDFYVTQDSFEVGRLQAEAAAKALGGKGNILILSGQAGHSVAAEITRGNIETLKKYPSMKVVQQQNHDNWSGSLAMKTVENTLAKQKNDIQVILANNSGMANGAVQALESQQLAGKVFVAGADAELAAIKNIVAGKQNFEVFKDFKPLAEKSAEIAVRVAKGEKITSDFTVNNGTKDVISFKTAVYPVEKSTVDSTVVASGFHTRQAIYGK